MSSLSYRTWDIWINTQFFESGDSYRGYFECSLLNTLMVPQTLEFLAEKYEIHDRRLDEVARASDEIIKQAITTEDGDICIRLYESLDTSVDKIALLDGILEFIESLSLCVDTAFTCPKISFISHQHGKILVANRRSIGRGVSFRVTERGEANSKLSQDLGYYQAGTDNFLVGKRHYLAGMQLLALEDHVSGLIDAAFMQFYQACEALCMHPTGQLEASKKFIASNNPANSRELQIIAHQVWKVRHKYFGHGDVSYNLHSNMGLDTAVPVARQVLVARYLCRRLLDIKAPSQTSFVREMGLFFGDYSRNFKGTVQELESNFRVDFDKRKSKIYSVDGEVIEEYSIG